MSLQEQSIYMAMELSKRTWRICFGDGGQNKRQVAINAVDARNLEDRMSFVKQIALAKKRFGLASNCKVISCYEAGRDGFWIHRFLTELGIENIVIDPSSIEVPRRARIRKTDRLDVSRLLDLLLRDKCYGLSRPYSVVVVPGAKDEDLMRLNRERSRLVKERGSHSVRIQALCTTHGIPDVYLDFMEDASVLRNWQDDTLAEGACGEIQRELLRLRIAEKQVKELERQQKEALEAQATVADQKAAKLFLIKGTGIQTAMLLGREVFGWRIFPNRRALGSFLGLTGTPYDSGETLREQGISKSGSGRLRTAMIEYAWGWVRYQPDSELTKWFNERFALGSARSRKKGIVALARKLIIALWKYVEFDEIPAGAKFKS